ncbi:hypothetical protein CYMTET_32375 [Cymbomonas tetramitiformis]|uniref:Uncharacterized protein n=1 Tax=Cymbomonas tetramitiformis TaxID=36881 RepID=A0AAE0FF76_9CHLO|nr:hypothetical protein CYMTET_32375 [Cymbomonas tetramitiformis]
MSSRINGYFPTPTNIEKASRKENPLNHPFRGVGTPTDRVEKTEGALTGLVSVLRTELGATVDPPFMCERERSQASSSNLRKSIMKHMHDVTIGLDPNKGKLANLQLALDEANK